MSPDTAERSAPFASRQPAADPLLRNVPPHSAEAERAVLGAVMIDGRAIDDVAQSVAPEDFYQQAHAQIYETILDLHRQNKPVDVVLLNEELEGRGILEQVGGTAFLAELCEVVPTAANAEYYARIVRDRAVQRRLIEIAAQVQRDAFETSGAVDELLDRAEQSMFEVTQRRIRAEAVAVGDVVQEAYDQLVAREQGQGVSGLPSYFADLDEVSGGFLPGEMTIIAARPSMGKCLAHDAEVLLEDGSVATMAELYARRSARLLTLADDWRLRWTEPSVYVDDGVKPVFRVTTRLGRTIETTITHPFRRIDGWVPLAEVRPGDRIAVPRRLDVFGRERWRDCEVRLLGQRLGDGEEVPAEAFRLERDQLALLLRSLWAASGATWVADASGVRFTFATASERLARQVQHLLLRFGAIASLAEREEWQLEVHDALSLEVVLEELTPPSEEQTVSRVRLALSDARRERERELLPVRVGSGNGERWSALAQRAGLRGTSSVQGGRRAASRRGLTALASALDDLALRDLAASDVYWDEVVAIEPAGEKQVYDLEIPHTHNFVANDVCVHNTSFTLNILRNVVLHGGAACFFSLEMPRIQVTSNMLCGIARLDGHRLRGGFLTKDEKRSFLQACEVLQPAQLFIDDNPTLSTMELRAKGRRLRAQHKVDILAIDYMQLMTGSSRAAKESRQMEVSEISRQVKALARELEIPIICLAQLSRKVEERKDKKPMMSDLRESGCLTGDTLIPLPDEGRRMPLRELEGKSGFAVWAMDPDTFKLRRAEVSRAFTTGVKPVFRLTTRLGRMIRATANHRFFTLDGWRRLDELGEGDRVALPRRYPQQTAESMAGVACGGTAVALQPVTVATETDLLWDPIESITPDSEERVYDLTVPGPHNFVADEIVVHNSIEQDADKIILLYRPEYYEPDKEELKGKATIVVAKNRNGPTGEVEMYFHKSQMRFETLTRM